MKNFIVYLTESHRIALKVKIDFDKCKFIKVQALDIFTAVHIAKDIQKMLSPDEQKLKICGAVEDRGE
jgi:hypothetical protein